MAIARRSGEVHWPKEWQRRMRDAQWHSQTNLRQIAARGLRWGSQRTSGGSSHGAAKRLGNESLREARAIGPKESTNCHEGQRILATNRRDGTAKRIGDELSRGACTQSGPTESTKRREGQKNLRYKSSLGARAMAAKIIYDINRC